MKLLTVVGTRPQFIKMVLLSQALEKRGIDEIIVHTGQHYDLNMSDIFFTEFKIRRPDYTLHTGGKTHGRMTGEMLIRLEEICLEKTPDAVLIYGDCNTTLAAALAASKLHIPVIHVESGLRSGDKKMPEELNRILSDNLSKILLCPTETARLNLNKEGIHENIYVVGDLMIDLLRSIRKDKNNDQAVLSKNTLQHKQYVLLTLHRQATTTPETLPKILEQIGTIQFKIIFPIHPRTRKIIQEYSMQIPDNTICIDPVGYTEMLSLLDQSLFVLTDSGGLQKEAYELKVPCVTLRDTTEWPETLVNGWNRLSDLSRLPSTDEILKDREWISIFPSDVADKITDIIAFQL